MQLNIHQLCHEKWSNMSPSEKGKFCASCQKEVVDFTQFTDQQLIDFFKQQRSGENTCGRLQTHQLNRALLHNTPTSHWPSITLASVLSLLGIAGFAQTEPETILIGETLYTPITQPEKETQPEHTPVDSVTLPSEVTITGKVIDAESKESLFVANVIQKGAYNGVLTDVDGNFSITVTTQDNVELSFFYIGYETQIIKLSPSELLPFTKRITPPLIIELNLQTQLTGEVSIIKQPSLFSRIKYKTKNFFSRIFH